MVTTLAIDLRKGIGIGSAGTLLHRIRRRLLHRGVRGNCAFNSSISLPTLSFLSRTLSLSLSLSSSSSSSSLSPLSSCLSSNRSRFHSFPLSRPFSTMSDDSLYILNTYARQPFVFVRGSGSNLYDDSGKEYIDFYSGIAVNALGHSHPIWIKGVEEQLRKLCHVSNLYYSQPQVSLAKQLIESSSFHKVFFCNSGTEANEAALKFARKYSYVQTNANPTRPNAKINFLSFNGGFHGRTIGSLSLTYKKAYKEPFYPLMEGCVKFVDYNDTASAVSSIDQNTCAVIVEPIQGEGGVNIGKNEFLISLRRRCTDVGALLIFDEVQVGLGRMGKLFAHQNFICPGEGICGPACSCGEYSTNNNKENNVHKEKHRNPYGNPAGHPLQPDMISLAKPLAGGLPIGALLLKQHVAEVMKRLKQQKSLYITPLFLF